MNTKMSRLGRRSAGALLIALMVTTLGGCAGASRMPAWVEHVFPMQGTPPDSPEQREVATHNEAASYLAYQAERHRVLAAQDKLSRRIKLVSIADTKAMQETVRSLVPLGSDIADAKVALELNGFECAWEGWRKKRLRCDVAKEAPAPRQWDIKIACQRTAVSEITVSLVSPVYAPSYTR